MHLIDSNDQRHRGISEDCRRVDQLASQAITPPQHTRHTRGWQARGRSLTSASTTAAPQSRQVLLCCLAGPGMFLSNLPGYLSKPSDILRYLPIVLALINEVNVALRKAMKASFCWVSCDFPAKRRSSTFFKSAWLQS